MQRLGDPGYGLGQLPSALAHPRRLISATLALTVALAAGPARGERPTEGGLWAYDASDELDFVEDEDERVRVHFAVAGPSQTLLADEDQDGDPDYPQLVLEVALLGLDAFAELGFRPPVSEAELGLGPLGGSGALDIYLLDFQGNSDGVFGLDGCQPAPRHCVGWMGLENDFAGYSYPSLQQAVDTVVVHELFHATQAAYHGSQPIWFSEGTATWAQRIYDPGSVDFLRKCDGYLALAERPIDRPPAGPVPIFAYGTALFWWFVHERFGAEFDVDLQAMSESPDGSDLDLIAELELLIDDYDDSLAETWFAFARTNLATGPRANPSWGYSFAAQLDGVVTRAEGPTLADDARYQPLAASYYRLDHGGGELAAGVDTSHPQLQFSLHPVADGGSDGPVETAVFTWTGADPGPVALGDWPPGGYWIVASLAADLDSSAVTQFCAGSPAFTADCLGVEGGDGDGDGDADGDDDGDGGATGDSGDPDTDGGAAAEQSEGCACSADDGPGGWASLVLLPLFGVALRRRQARALPAAKSPAVRQQA